MWKHCTHYKVALLLLTVAQWFRGTIYGTALFSPGCVIKLQCSKPTKKVHKEYTNTPAQYFWSATSELTRKYRKHLLNIEFSVACRGIKVGMILETHCVCCLSSQPHIVQWSAIIRIPIRSLITVPLCHELLALTTSLVISHSCRWNFNFPSPPLDSSLCPPSTSQQVSEVTLSILHGSLAAEK